MKFFEVLLLCLVLLYPQVLARRRRELEAEENGPSQDTSKLHFAPEENEPVYTNKWVVHIEDGVEKAEELARKHGFKFHGQIGGLEDYYLLEHSDVQKRTRRSVERHSLLSNEPIVRWAEQQKILKRSKREFQDFTDPLFKDQWYLKNRGRKNFIWKFVFCSDAETRSHGHETQFNFIQL